LVLVFRCWFSVRQPPTASRITAQSFR
jgi:hypothetical protein